MWKFIWRVQRDCSHGAASGGKSRHRWAHPTLLAACGADVALADSVNRLLYRQGRASTLPPGVEVLRCWRNQLLTLSSETNCLTLYDAHDYPLVTSPAGIRPCDCVVVDCQVIVCGCEDGCLHIFSLPDLREIAAYPVPGCPMRVAAGWRSAHLPVAAEPRSAAKTLLFRLCLTSGDFAPVALLPRLVRRGNNCR